MFSTFNGTNRVLLTVVAGNKCNEAPRASRTLLDYWKLQKLPKRFFSMYLRLCSQPIYCKLKWAEAEVEAIQTLLNNVEMYEKAKGVSWGMVSLGKCQGQNRRFSRTQGFWPRDFLRDSIHHDRLKCFPTIFILSSSRTNKEGFLALTPMRHLLQSAGPGLGICTGKYELYISLTLICW